MSALDRLFAPTWAGGWTLSRWLFAGAMLSGSLPRRRQIAESLAHPEVVFTSGPLYLVDQVALGPAGAYGLWALGLLGIAGLLWGGRLAKPGLGLWLLTYYPLVSLAGLSARVPERLMLLVALGLLMGPIGERGLTKKQRSPAPRWFLLILACALYGSTGLLKATQEPAWWTGQALAYDLVDLHFGLQPVGIWLSAQPELVKLLSWGTIFLEASAPILLLWRRSNPWILLGLGCMHLGIESLMIVGALTFATLAMYPVLLHPDVARSLWLRAEGWRTRRSDILARP